ncbi:MAG: 30S ribosomal protein S27ae [Candidatus Nanoarchaeia archaeon]|nr:30S ribosomal protein S27ae [Candidatus Nanoarchaeia archaeon]
MGKKRKVSKTKGKKKKNPTPVSKKWEKYESKEGKVVRKQNFCPKCGPGTFMAKHKDRQSCGKCKYTVFKKE